MTKLTQKSFKQFFGTIRTITLALFLIILGANAALAQTKGYVTNADDNTVSVIDTATQAVVATVPVGGFPRGLAVTPNGAFVYVANLNDNSVSVISAATSTVTATVPAGAGPFDVAITPNSAFVYVTNQFGG